MPRIVHLPPPLGTGFELFRQYRCPQESIDQGPPSPYVYAQSIALASKSESPRVLTEPEIKDYISVRPKAMGNIVHGI